MFFITNDGGATDGEIESKDDDEEKRKMSVLLQHLSISGQLFYRKDNRRAQLLTLESVLPQSKISIFHRFFVAFCVEHNFFSLLREYTRFYGLGASSHASLRELRRAAGQGAAPLVGSIVSCLTFAMALAATAIVERERRTSNRSFVEFLVGDRVHVLEPVQFAGTVGTVVKRNVGSVVVRLEGSNVSLEALHSQLRGFGEFRADDRVRTLGAGTYGFAAFYAGLVHVFCWYAQIHPGHGIYEGRKPALLDSAIQSFLDAPLFVWYEVAFACGYDPALKQELDAAVEKQHAAWDL